VAQRRNVRFALDTSGPPLNEALHQGVDLLKTSLREFQSIIGTNASEPDALAKEALRMIASRTASTIAVTLGAQGAILATSDGYVATPALIVPVQSTVGAGDSFLAGLVLGLACSQPPEEALRLAIATSAAAIMNRGTARVDRRQVEALVAGPFIADARSR
jgi:6-phosphofructokinase 2